MWNFEALRRPTIFEVNRYLGFLLDQIDCHVPFELLTAPSDHVGFFRCIFFTSIIYIKSSGTSI